jgi:hypothetical protein
MSFFSDLFKGNFSNLGSDLNPSNIFSDTTKDIGGKYTIPELLGGAALVGGGLALGPELFGGAAAGAAGAAGAGAAAGAPLDLLAGGAAAGTADPAAIGTIFAGGLGGAADASLSVGSDVLGFTGAGTDAFAADPGITAINAAAPLGATDATTALGTATAAPNAATAATNAAQPSWWQDLLGGAEKSITKNPLGILASGAGLATSFFRGNQTDPNQQALQNEAPAMAAQGAAIAASGQQLQTYLNSGTLPPALQSQVTSAVEAEKARIISNHAANGENTNPTQNSALAQELSQADINGLNLAGQLEQQLFSAGTQLLNTGLSETGLSTQLYETLVKMDQTNNNQLMQSIASMAAALGGGTKLNIGTTGVTVGA